jgi:hypothetical protein
MAMGMRKPDELDKTVELLFGAAGLRIREEIGQNDVAHDDRLPIEMGLSDEQLTALGFKLGENLDSQFRKATFPKGWKKRPFPDHHMWNYILDDKGRIRARFFFKAAAYDYDAHGDFRTRFGVESVSTGEGVLEGIAAVDRSDPYDREKHWAGTLGIRLQVFPTANYSDEKPRKKAEAWLTEKHPNWKDPLAYWD